MNYRNRVRDRKRRRRVDRYSLERAVRKSMSASPEGGHESEKGRENKKAVWAVRQLGKYPRDVSEVRVVNRCVETGFARSSRSYGLSRFERRDQCRRGLLAGVKKASW